LAVERVDDAGAPARDTSGVDLASKMKTSVVSPRWFGKRWMKELPSVVWSLRATPS
jgi:hypothetical protein